MSEASLFGPHKSFRDILEPAIKIALDGDHDMAGVWLEGYVAYLSTKMSKAEAEQVALDNLGYFAGYYDQETMDAVRVVFGAVHPFLGHQDRFGRAAPPPTVEEAFAIGVRWGEMMKRKAEG